MNYTAAMFWVLAADVVVTAVMAVYFYRDRRDQVRKQRLYQFEHEVGERLSSHDSRLARVETGAKRIPSHDDIGKLHQRIDAVRDCISQLKSEVSGTRGSMEALTHQVGLLMEHHIRER